MLGGYQDDLHSNINSVESEEHRDHNHSWIIKGKGLPAKVFTTPSVLHMLSSKFCLTFNP